MARAKLKLVKPAVAKSAKRTHKLALVTGKPATPVVADLRAALREAVAEHRQAVKALQAAEDAVNSAQQAVYLGEGTSSNAELREARAKAAADLVAGKQKASTVTITSARARQQAIEDKGEVARLALPDLRRAHTEAGWAEGRAKHAVNDAAAAIVAAHPAVAEAVAAFRQAKIQCEAAWPILEALDHSRMLPGPWRVPVTDGFLAGQQAKAQLERLMVALAGNPGFDVTDGIAALLRPPVVPESGDGA